MNQDQMRKKYLQILDDATDEMSAVYTSYNDQIIQFLTDALLQDDSISPKFSQAYINSQVAELLAALQEEVLEIAQKQTEEALILGLLLFYSQLDQPITRKEAVEILAYQNNGKAVTDSVMESMRTTFRNTGARLSTIIRQAFTMNSVQTVAGDRQRDSFLKLLKSTQSADKFQETLRKEGFVGFVDKRGARWNPDVYAKMVLRTKWSEAIVGLQKELGLREGVDLAWISNANVTNPCHNWEYVIISLNGMTKGFPSYEEVKATLEVFHPNCQHYLNLIRDIKDAPAVVLATTERKYGFDLSEYK